MNPWEQNLLQQHHIRSKEFSIDSVVKGKATQEKQTAFLSLTSEKQLIPNSTASIHREHELTLGVQPHHIQMSTYSFSHIHMDTDKPAL